MSAAASAALLGFGRSSARTGGVHLDSVTIALTLGIVLLGLVMVTSASVSIAGQDTGQPFYYLERQLLLTLSGAACAALVFSIPTALLERASVPVLAVAIGLLLIVLIPGVGHAVNGSRRWLRLAGVNFQVSELARVLVLVYVASYAVRRETQHKLGKTFRRHRLDIVAAFDAKRAQPIMMDQRRARMRCRPSDQACGPGFGHGCHCQSCCKADHLFV